MAIVEGAAYKQPTHAYTHSLSLCLSLCLNLSISHSQSFNLCLYLSLFRQALDLMSTHYTIMPAETW